MDEHRKYKRYDIDSTVFFLNNITESVNLSIGGVQIKSEEEISIQDVISLCVLLQDNNFIQVYGHIVWQAMNLNTDYTYGIQFINLSDNDKYLLSENLMYKEIHV